MIEAYVIAVILCILYVFTDYIIVAIVKRTEVFSALLRYHNWMKKSSRLRSVTKTEPLDPRITGLKVLAAMIAKCYSQHYRLNDAKISTTLNHGSKSRSGRDT